MIDRTPYQCGSVRQAMIVGCGRLGSAFAEALTLRGLGVIPVSARRPQSSQELAGKLQLPHAFPDVEAARQAPPVDLILLTVPDLAISTIGAEVLSAGLPQPGMLVAHPSGNLPAAAILPCRQAGALIASFHPLQTFPRGVGDGERFRGITFAFEGDSGALPALRELAIRLGATVFQIQAEHKAAYHTAAVLACNCLVALLHVAVQLFGQAGSLPGESMSRLRPLVDATLDNLTDLGAVGALTGPVARGDAATIASQLEVVQQRLPEHLPLYRELTRSLLELAEARGDADAEGIARIAELLDQVERQATGSATGKAHP
jgi:predicted short-subunit dehydrogenase-like oxidoreductase (DUF2520 family)